MLPSLTSRGLIAAANGRAESIYGRLSWIYGHILARRLRCALLVAKKWQDEDLIWPHSDIDVRVVLDKAPYDWLAFNRTLAEIHLQLVSHDPLHWRLLEHPPGAAFIYKELEGRLVPASEVATWSHCYGDTAAVLRWRTRAASTPWTAEDERFYRGVLNSRVGGNYCLDRDSPANVTFARNTYAAHCISWHYAAPIAFADSALRTRHRFAGKCDAIRSHDHPQIACYADLASNGYRHVPDVQEVLARSKFHIENLPVVLDTVRSFFPTLPEMVSAIGLLRCRLARYLYYLNPPRGVATDYLVTREAKDVSGAVRVIQAGISLLPERLHAPARWLCGVIPRPPFTRDHLRYVVEEFTNRRDTLNALFSCDFTAVAGSSKGVFYGNN